MGMSLSGRLASYQRQGGGVLTGPQRRRAARKSGLTPAEVDQVWMAARAAHGAPGSELAQAFASMLGPAAVSLARWQRQVLAALTGPGAGPELMAALGAAGRGHPGRLEYAMRNGLPRGRAATRVSYDETPIIPRASAGQAGWARGGVMDHVAYGTPGGNSSFGARRGAVSAEGSVTVTAGGGQVHYAGGGGGGCGGPNYVAGDGVTVAVDGGGVAWIDEAGAFWAGDAGTHPDGWLPREAWEVGPDVYRATFDPLWHDARLWRSR